MDLSTLNEPQKQAVETTEGPLLILAGAGSGKTKVLTARTAFLIAEKNVSPYRILALTFTNKAANEMRERIIKAAGNEAQRVWIHTFHGFCARVLSSDCERLGYKKGFLIYDVDDQQSLLGTIIKDLQLNDKVYTKRMLQDLFSKAKNHSDNPEAYLRASYQPRQVMEAYALYEKKKMAANAMDFDDLLLKTIELFNTCPDILERYRDLFRYIMVDEYQDTNMSQYKIISLLAAAHQNLCVVGDDDQSIYGWRGADIRNILEFEKDFPGAAVVRLEQNYRSSQPILDAANRVIAHNAGRKEKKLWTARTEGQPITVYEARGEKEEATFIAERILNGKRLGKRFDDYAILYRTHAQSRIMEMILQSMTIPYKIYGGTAFFSRTEVKDAVAYLRLICNPGDDVSFQRIANVPRRNIGMQSLEELKLAADKNGISLFEAAERTDTVSPKVFAKFAPFTELMHTLSNLYDKKSVVALLEGVLRKIGYEAYLKASDPKTWEARWENVQELVGFAQEFEDCFDSDSEEDPLQAFLNTASLFMTADRVDEESGCVNLMTLHAAKGLEFDTVFLTGMEEGVFPSQQSIREPEKLAEERRLCYVGVTRARNKLFLSYAESRSLFGQYAANPPSRFLDEMGDTISMPGSGFVPRPASASVHRGAVVSPHREPFTAPKVIEGTKPVSRKPAAGAASAAFKDGDRVKHGMFGAGTVVGIEGSGSTQIITIKFDKGPEKRLSTAYANLKPAED